MTTRPGAVVDAVVLAGGQSSRLGTDKARVPLHGRRLLDHALDATLTARRRVVVGPADLAPPGVLAAREDPPFGGPVAGIAAGLAALDDDGAPAEWILVLACDVPRATAAVRELLTVPERVGPDVDGAFLTSRGRDQWLVGLYRRSALEAALDALRSADGTVHGARTGALVARLRCLRIDDPDDASADVDTWHDLERAGREEAP